MYLLYSFSILLYGLAIKIAAIFDKKAALWVKGRKNNALTIEIALSDSCLKRKERKLVWFHCASLGEFEQGRPLMEAFRKLYPESIILLTFFSPSGYENRKSYTGADLIFYLPLDTRRNAKRFLDIVQPDIVFFVKYEFWFNYLSLLQNRSIPHYLVSAIFRPDQHFFRWYGDWSRSVLKGFTHIFVQNQYSKELLDFVDIPRTTVSGDTRFDRVAGIASLQRDFPLLESFARELPIVVAGSTWPADEELIIRFWKEHSNKIKLIIAPHEIHEEAIVALVNRIGNSASRYSKLTPEAATGCQVLIIDSIGMLSQIYRYGQIACIGGGFGSGIHNILEAAVYGMPVIFGPNYGKFHEAVELISCKGGFHVKNYREFEPLLHHFLTDSSFLSEASTAAKHYVASHTGATATILQTIREF